MNKGIFVGRDAMRSPAYGIYSGTRYTGGSRGYWVGWAGVVLMGAAAIGFFWLIAK